MSTKERIEAVLQQYKDILLSYRGVFGRTAIEAGHNEDAPEYGFEMQLMTNPHSNLLTMVGSLFNGIPLSQALQQIEFWKVMYIDVQETGNRFSYEGTPEHEEWKAIGQTFLDNARAVADRWCNKDEATQRVGGVDHPKKVQQKKVQTQIFNWDADKPKSLLIEAANRGLIEPEGNGYRWIRTAALYGYFIDKVSYHLDIRPSNNRIPWQKFVGIIKNHDILVTSAKQAVNDYKNKNLSPPEGDDIVNGLINL